MTSVWASDLHLNDNPKDQYRWDILPWLEQEGSRLKADFIGVGGDITDAKDRHGEGLVNRIGDHFAKSKHKWVVVSGNHDGIAEGSPFFRFLGHFPNVKWITKPTVAMDLPVDARKPTPTLLLPSTRDWQTVWGPSLGQKYRYTFLHGTFEGTTAENGFLLPGGIPREPFKALGGHVYAGDIHTPQQLEDWLAYIGCPYRVHFGDTFKPRALYFGKDIEDLHPPMIFRHVVVVRRADDLAKFPEIQEHDQVKIRVRLKRSEFPEWRQVRTEVTQAAEARGWSIHGIELFELATVRRRLDEPQGEDAVRNGHAETKGPEQRIQEYAAAQKWSESVTKFGQTLFRGQK